MLKALRLVLRLLLGGALIYAGISHLTFSRQEFQAQVPVWLPLDADFVVLASGVVEIMLGIGIASFGALVPIAGLAAAAFFIAIFPGNINQYVEGISAFGLDTDQDRFVRLFFQPVLVIWALWSTSAVGYLKAYLKRRESDSKT
jgi:Predicted membrane protein